MIRQKIWDEAEEGAVFLLRYWGHDCEWAVVKHDEWHWMIVNDFQPEFCGDLTGNLEPVLIKHLTIAPPEVSENYEVKE